VTVLSRCLQFNLKQMPPGHIVSHLENILGQEDIPFDPPALRLLAQGAQGSMRDALSLTDQAIAYAAGKVTLDAVQGMLGALDHSYLVRVLDALSAQDGKTLLAVADEMAARSLSWSGALQDLGTLLNRIAIAQTVPTAVPDDLPEREDILRLAQLFTPEDVQLCYQIVVHGRHELGLAPDEYAGFTMTLLRMLAFAPVSASGQTQSASPSPRAMPAAAPRSAATAAAVVPPVVAAASGATERSQPAKAASPAMAALAAGRSKKAAAPPPPVDDTLFASEPVDNVDPAQKKTEEPVTLPVPEASAAKFDWPVLVKQLDLRGVAQQLAMQSELLSCKEDDKVMVMRIRVPIETLLSAGSKEKLTASLSEHLGKTVRLDTEIGATRMTAHAADVAEQTERQRTAEQTLQDDPFVQTLIRDFGATVVPGSVRPV